MIPNIASGCAVNVGSRSRMATTNTSASSNTMASAARSLPSSASSPHSLRHREMQHHLLAVDVGIGELGPSRDHHHQAVAGRSSPVDESALGVGPRLAPADQRVEGGIGQSPEECIALEEGANAVWLWRICGHGDSPISGGRCPQVCAALAVARLKSTQAQHFGSIEFSGPLAVSQTAARPLVYAQFAGTRSSMSCDRHSRLPAARFASQRAVPLEGLGGGGAGHSGCAR